MSKNQGFKVKYTVSITSSCNPVNKCVLILRIYSLRFDFKPSVVGVLLFNALKGEKAIRNK